MLNYMALVIAVCLSAVAGTISVLGLITIFSASPIWVAIVGGSLEVAKVVAATWLHYNWKRTSIWIKTYLSLAVVILMLITSMGVYGFFAKAHIDQQVSHSQNSSVQRISIIETKLTSLDSTVKNIDEQLTLITPQISKLSEVITGKVAEKGQSRADRADVDKARVELTRLRNEQNDLVKRRENALQELNALRVEKVGLSVEQKKLEAEVGPIKYVAALFSDQTGTEQLEKAVRYMILLLVFVFDPLAIMLIIAAYSNMPVETKPTPIPAIPPVLQVVGGKDVRKIARRKRKRFRRLKVLSDEKPDKKKKPVLDLTKAKL